MTRLAFKPHSLLLDTFRPADAAPAATPMVMHVRVVAGAGGGPDKTILRSPSHIDASGLRMACAYIHPQDDPKFNVIRGHASRFNCPLHEVPEAGALDVRTIRHLLQLCEQHRVTVWHGHDYKSDLLGLILRRFRPMKLVTTVHGFTGETWRTCLYEHVDNWCLRRYDQVIAVSPQLVEHCKRHGVREDRLTYIPNGIDLSEYERQRDAVAARDLLGLDREATLIGVVGRLSVEKGVDRAIRALAAIRQTHQEAQLHLIGDGPERGNLERLAIDLNVQDHVYFHGWQKNSLPHYEAMDMLLLPSHTEGCPNVVLEAMAMGVPVAATNVGNVSELLDAGQCGVVLPQDPVLWPRQMAMMLTSEPWRQAVARKARARVEEHYTFRKRMDRVLRVYDRVLRVDRGRDVRRIAA